MTNQVYPWKRFWCSRSGSINLGDNGYLYDPEAEWAKIYNPDLVTFEAICDLPCLALLGEPGIGKSHAIKVEQKEIISKVQKQGDQVLFLDLRSYGSEDRLIRRLFESSEFTTWIGGEHHLHIFLDSFDECLLRVNTLATLLVDEFKCHREKVNRLHIRIACRTAVWQPVLEEGLKEIWGKECVGVYELAPLRRVDIMEAARAEKIPPDAFVEEVQKKNVTPLAIKPVTLRFLLNTYRRHNGHFPPNQRLHELYLEGCRLLCEEVSQSRLGSNLRGILDSDQRLIVAARIAAITIFANRFGIWTAIDQGDVPDEDVLLQKLCWGSESIKVREFEITRAVVEEVLDTGLFSSRGLHRMGWAHQTYTEFLAAWYLVQHDVPLTQIKELILSSEDPEHKLVPQLHETAAWLASMRLDVLQEILKSDPDALLRSDIPTDSNLLEAIVNHLLMEYEQEKLYDHERNHYLNYRKLKHPDLAVQLRPYIQDSNKQIDARDTAIDIAEVCEVGELQEELVNLALDASQSIHLRVSAAKALGSVGDVSTRQKLKPLAINQLPEDEDDRLKGYALQAIWSDHLTAEELFQALTSPKKRNFFGAYQMFLNYKLASQLQPDDIVIALNWIEKQGVRCFGHPFEEVSDAILIKAWEHFDLPGVAESFTNVALVQWREHQRVITHNDKLQKQFESSLVNDVENRHKLINQTVRAITFSRGEPYFLLSSLTETVLVQGDIFWMLEELQDADCQETQRIWTQFIEWSFNRQDAKEIDVLITATQSNDVLHEAFTSYFEAVELNSAKAEGMKVYYLEAQERQNRRDNPPVLEPSPKERVLQLLDQLEAENLDAWWQLNREMTLEPCSQYYGNEFEIDLTKLPGWQDADKVTQKRIIDGAKRYIRQQDKITYDWIGTNRYNLPALGGCRALWLLLEKEPSFIDALSSETWKRWAAITVAAPTDNQRQAQYLEIIKRAYINAPDEAINTLMTLIDKENQEHNYLFIIDRFEQCWDERFKLTLLEKVKDKSLKPKCLGQLLEALLKHDLSAAREFAKSLIYSPLPSVEEERERVFTASRVLIENSEPSDWSFIWSLVQQDVSFGRTVLELVADRYSLGIQLNLTEEQLANLYIWLLRQYPYEEDPDYSNEVIAHIETVRESIGNLRDNILAQLKEKGTLQACSEIQRVAQEFPDMTWLKKTLLAAQKNMRRRTWQSPTPEQILQIVTSKMEVKSTYIQAEVFIMQGTDNPNLDFSGSVGAVNLNSTVHGDQIGTQHNHAQEQSLVEAYAEIQQIFNRLTKDYPTTTEPEKQAVVAKAVEQVKGNPTLKNRLTSGGKAFIFEALQKASDQWWVSPFVKAIEAGIKGE